MIYRLAIPEIYPCCDDPFLPGPRMRYFLSRSADMPVVFKKHFGLFQVSQPMRSEAVGVFYEHRTVIARLGINRSYLLSCVCTWRDSCEFRRYQAGFFASDTGGLK